MRRTTLIGITLGGAALLAIPAGVAYAAPDASDTAHFMSRGNHAQGADNRGGSPFTAGTQNLGPSDSCALGMGASVEVERGSTITDTEAASLRFMIEEEKLAHDLYLELGDAWDLRVFVNIASAEQQHTEAVRALIDSYGLDDPTEGLGAGEFADPTLDALYDSLLATGLTSRSDALMVGGLVEETDILDLQARSSDNAAIVQVFGQLEAASENHLRAFAMNLARLGIDYEAQVMSPAEVEGIIGQ